MKVVNIFLLGIFVPFVASAATYAGSNSYSQTISVEYSGNQIAEITRINTNNKLLNVKENWAAAPSGTGFALTVPGSSKIADTRNSLSGKQIQYHRVGKTKLFDCKLNCSPSMPNLLSQAQ